MNKMIKTLVIALSMLSITPQVSAAATAPRPEKSPEQIKRELERMTKAKQTYNLVAAIGLGSSLAVLGTLSALNPSTPTTNPDWARYRKNTAYSAFGIAAVCSAHLAKEACRSTYGFAQKVIKKIKPFAVFAAAGIGLALFAGVAIKLLDRAKGDYSPVTPAAPAITASAVTTTVTLAVNTPASAVKVPQVPSNTPIPTTTATTAQASTPLQTASPGSVTPEVRSLIDQPTPQMEAPKPPLNRGRSNGLLSNISNPFNT